MSEEGNYIEMKEENEEEEEKEVIIFIKIIMINNIGRNAV